MDLVEEALDARASIRVFELNEDGTDLAMLTETGPIVGEVFLVKSSGSKGDTEGE